MICPNCQTENRQVARYCKECGQFLAANCPSCGAELPEGAKFCDMCGYRLATAPVAQRRPALSGSATPAPQAGRPAETTYLRKYIPQELLAKLATAQLTGEMAGERRVVTMLFCDVKGSTAAAERLDAEEWAEIINGAFEHMIAPVYRYEGTVARLMGDGILAFFGAPIAHEDDPVRGVLAGLDIAAGIDVYCQALKKERGLDLNVRIGVNTGEVVVGTVGSDLRLEYTALGDAINVAARMEQTAQPGTVQIAEHTYRLVASLFEVEDLGPVSVKGKSEAIRAYRVLGRRAEPARQRGIAGRETPLVGRDSEMAALQQAMAGLQRGRGQLLFLVGKAGLGKSRLIHDGVTGWLEREAGSDGLALWFHRHIPSYESSETYGVLRSQIRLMAGINENTPPDQVRAALAGEAAGLPDQLQESALATWASLLGVKQEADSRSATEGEAFKRQLFTTTLEAVRAHTLRQPAALIVDDLQWVDPASAEIIQHLFQLVDTVPILFLCAMRPDREALSWQVKSAAEANYPHRYGEIELQSLDEQESDALLRALLNDADLPPELRNMILERAEGNPFFIEEVVHALMDSGTLRKSNGQTDWQVTTQGGPIAVPDSLQALLLARIDRLSDGARHILQLASVIGPTFHYRVLQQVYGSGPELDELLATLQRQDLIVETERVPEWKFAFRGALLHETVYRAILNKQRRENHQQVAEAIEACFGDRLNEHAAELAFHFYEAGDERALAYSIQAGDDSYRLYANREALVHYSRALDGARRLATPSAGQLLHIFARRGRALELNSQFAQALANYQEMEAVAQERGDRQMELAAVVAADTVYSIASDQFNPEMAEEKAHRALRLAQELGDEEAEAKIYWNLLNVYRFTDRMDQARTAGEQSLSLSRKLDLREQLAFTANDMPHVYMDSGRLAEAVQLAYEAIGLWRELGNQPMLADSLATASLVTGMRGQSDASISMSDESYQISRAIDNLWGQSYSRFFVGMVYWEQGEPDKAITTMEASLKLGEQAGFLPAQLWLGSQLATFYARLGQMERALVLAEGAHNLLTQQFSTYYRPFTLGALAYVLLLDGQVEEGEARLAELDEEPAAGSSALLGALNEARWLALMAKGDYVGAARFAAEFEASVRRVEAGLELPLALIMRARSLVADGQLEESRPVLVEARSEAEALGSNWPLWQILAISSDVEAQQGQDAAAGVLRQEAGQVVQAIADRLPTADLRASFLATEAVSNLVGQGKQ